MASLTMLSTVAAAIPMGNMNLFSRCNGLRKHSDSYDNSENTKKVIILIMRITTEQIMMIIIIINNNQVITTTMMVMKTIKKYLITIVMIMIITNIVITLQKTKNMSVKQDSLRAFSSNQ